MGNQSTIDLMHYKEKNDLDITSTTYNHSSSVLPFQTRLAVEENKYYQKEHCPVDLLHSLLLKTSGSGNTEGFGVSTGRPFGARHKHTKTALQKSYKSNVLKSEVIGKFCPTIQTQQVEGYTRIDDYVLSSRVNQKKDDEFVHKKKSSELSNQTFFTSTSPRGIVKESSVVYNISDQRHNSKQISNTVSPEGKVTQDNTFKSKMIDNKTTFFNVVNILKNTIRLSETTMKREDKKSQIELNKGDLHHNKPADMKQSADENNLAPSKASLADQLSFNSDISSPGYATIQSSKIQDEGEGKGTDGYKPEDTPLKNIRNFSIIAHIDHGKSTLADRLLEMTGTMMTNPDNKQVLDRLQVEKERGITVKAQTASLFYKYKGEEYLLNLIDTPGHVDFSSEVSRSLAACQGVILLVDANQGVQAQTVANFYLAFSQDLTILPVLNKVDLKNANPEQVKDQLFNLFTIDPEDILMISAKMGTGVESVLEALIKRLPPPPGDRSAPLRALVFDSWFDRYRGAMALVYIRDGVVKVGDEISSAHSKRHYTVKGLGMLRPHEQPTKTLVGGQVGYVVCNMRSVSEAYIGDTLHLKGSTIEPLTGFKPARPMVYAGLYPLEKSELLNLRSALEKLSLNDPAVTVVTDSSPVLGQGWRVGFLGLLHLEVFNQRLEQEYGAEAIMTAPSVTYKVKILGKKNIGLYGGEEILVSDPSKMPDRSTIKEISEPMVLGTIITPVEYISKVIAECMERRGVQANTVNIDHTRVMLQFELPLNEVIVDFHDNLKSLTSGFASFDYEDHGFAPSDMVKLDILLNGDIVESLSSIVHSSKAAATGKRMCAKLAEIIPRQMVQVSIQAAIGGKIVARDNIRAFRKDVTAKLYGGDVTRKMKLLHKQSEGKKKMKKIANVNIPREAFIDYLKR